MPETERRFTMYVGSKSHGEKIFHHIQCTYVRRIKDKNKVYFYSEEEARTHGFRICDCCSRIGKYYREEKNEIAEFARKNQMKVRLYDGAIYLKMFRLSM